MMAQHLLSLAVSVPAVSIPPAQANPPEGGLLEAMGLLVVLAVVGICLMAFTVTLAALLPGLAERSKTVLERSPWRAFWVGLANYLFLGGISLVLLNIQPLAVLGLLLGIALGGVTMLGLPGLADLLGQRIAGLRGQEFSAWQRLLWGTLALELAGLLPFVGWFLLTPVLLLMAFGTVVLSWFNRKQPEASGE